MEGGTAIDVLGTCVGPEFSKKDTGQISMTLSGCPVKPSHFEIIDIKGKIGIGFK